MKTFKKLFSLTLIILSLGFYAFELNAQNGNLDNQATGKIINSGTIRFSEDAGQFRNANNTRLDLQNLTATKDGIIEFAGSGNQFTDGTGAPGAAPAYGLDVTWRVGGKVLYNSGSAQTMQDRYYTDLETDGVGEKTIPDGVFVYRVYTNGGGNRYYSGTFTYDGDDVSGQTIASENGADAGTNRYSTLSLTASDGTTVHTKTVATVAGAGGEVYVDEDIFSDAYSNLAANDDMYVGQNGGAVGTMNGTVTITPETGGIFEMEQADVTFNAQVDVVVGSFIMAGDGNANFNALTNVADAATFAMQDNITGQANVDGTLNLETGAGGGGLVSLGIATTMNINPGGSGGSYVNNQQDRLNTTYDPTSTVNFAEAQVVPTTVATNPYGNLGFTGTAGSDHTATSNTGTNNDIFAVGTINISDANLNMFGSTDGAVTLPGNYTPGNLTYTNGTTELAEIVGSLRYEGSLATSPFDQALVDAQVYTMNNAATQTTFTSAAGTLPNYWEFDLLPGSYGTTPADYIVATDVNRKITVNYQAAVTGWDATIQAWYLDTELPAASESIFKFFEANDPDGLEAEKIGGTGAPWVRDIPNNTLSLAGISGTAAAIDEVVDGEIFASNDLLIRANDVIYAVDDGRWSNPATWDEFREPTSDDNAVISGFTVHAGFVRPNVDNYTTVEAYPTNMAKSLLIDEPGGAYSTNTHSSLIFGGFTSASGDYNGGSGPFTYSLANGNPGVDHFIENKALNEGAAYGVTETDYATMVSQTIDRGAGTYTGTRQGILIYTTNATPTVSEVTMIHLLNSGSLENSGILTIGN